MDFVTLGCLVPLNILNVFLKDGELAVTVNLTVTVTLSQSSATAGYEWLGRRPVAEAMVYISSFLSPVFLPSLKINFKFKLELSSAVNVQ